MRDKESVIPLFGKEFEAKIESYFESFLVCFHSDNPKYKNLLRGREEIKLLPGARLKQEAYSAALSVIMYRNFPHKESLIPYEEKIVPFLTDRIHKYYLDYRKEYCSRIRIIIQNILNQHINN